MNTLSLSVVLKFYLGAAPSPPPPPPLAQVTAMNHRGSGSKEDSPETVLTLALERAALINYKMVYKRMEAASEEDPVLINST